MINIEQHQIEILRNKHAWETKPLLRSIYEAFYRQIAGLMNPDVKGKIVELGSGVGNLKSAIPHAICTDLFPNPWLDAVCSAYAMPFENGSVSHLVLFDVFHHLERPNAFFKEAKRVLIHDGRIIIFEPYISASSRAVYGLLHHEPVAWNARIDFSESAPPDDRYYAAQGNATRLFFRRGKEQWPEGWKVFHRQPFVCFSYLLSGGYSKPAMYPGRMLPMVQTIDSFLSRWPSLFAARCLIGLTPE
ncbi:MAG: class I SAM-dependent methyltransferase [Ignavibacteriae bacterium]|nr:MAG: class I SAM-dependent methyltransferase [Ignavibacteriota bacterium]